MPYDVSGNFTRSYNWTADKLAGIKIQSTRMDGEFDNYATALNQVLLRNGVTPLAGTLKLGGNVVSGLGAGVAGTPAIAYASDTTTGEWLPAAGQLAFSTGGVERVRLNSTGGYLIGSYRIGDNSAARTTLDIGGLSSIQGVFETCLLTATGIAGTVNIDYKSQALVIYDANATGNFSFNVRGNSATALDSILAVNQVLTLAVEVPQGTTAYYCTAITVDGLAPSQVKWTNGAPSSGNVSGIDVYLITVIKKAAATFYVRASLSQVK